MSVLLGTIGRLAPCSRPMMTAAATQGKKGRQVGITRHCRSSSSSFLSFVISSGILPSPSPWMDIGRAIYKAAGDLPDAGLLFSPYLVKYRAYLISGQISVSRCMYVLGNPQVSLSHARLSHASVVPVWPRQPFFGSPAIIQVKPVRPVKNGTAGRCAVGLSRLAVLRWDESSNKAV